MPSLGLQFQIGISRRLADLMALARKRDGEVCIGYKIKSHCPIEIRKEHIMVESEATSTPEPPSKEELRLAMKAFRKRLKLTRLDDESRMGYGPTSSGQRSGIVSITPPNQFPRAVWQELAKQGKLKHDGGALYSLIES